MPKTGEKSPKSTKPRQRQLNRKLARTKAKKEAAKRPVLPTSFKLIRDVLGILRKFWKPLAGIVLVYLILNIIFASGLGDLNSTVDSIKANLQASGGHSLLSALGNFALLSSSAGASTSGAGSALQGSLVILVSLVIIWALRQLLAGQAVRVKQAYYQSMTPLVPFILVIFFMLLQLLPVAFGSVVLSAITTSLSTSGFVNVIAIIIFGLLAAWSVYMVSSSIFALYIVTLPGVMPRDALRSAKSLVRFRRWFVLRRVLFLPVFLLLVMAVLTVPLILFATFLVAPVFYLLSMLAILFIHAYLYSLYRGLIA